MEGEFTTEQPHQLECSEDRTAVPSVMKTEREPFVYLHKRSTHTFERLQSCVTKPTNTEYIPITWEKPYYIFVRNPSIGQQLSQQTQHHTPSMELHYTATTANNFGPEWYTHWVVLPSVPTSHPWNEHQTACKPCPKQVKSNVIPLTPQGQFVSQSYHKQHGWTVAVCGSNMAM